MASEEPLLKYGVQRTRSKGYLNDLAPSIIDIAEGIDFDTTPLPHISLGWSGYRAACKRLMSAVRREFHQHMTQHNMRGTFKANIQDVQNKSKLLSAIQAIEHLNKVCWHSTTLVDAIMALEPNDESIVDSDSKHFVQAVRHRTAQIMLYMLVCAIPPDENMDPDNAQMLRRKPPPYEGDLSSSVLNRLNQENTDKVFETKHPMHLEWAEGGCTVFVMLTDLCAWMARKLRGGSNAWLGNNPNGWFGDLNMVILRQWEELTQSHLAILRERLDRATTTQTKMISLSSTAFLSLLSIAMRHLNQTQCE